MIGIVIVSHSRKLAEGVHELAAQMAQGAVPLAFAGGVDDPQNPLGTNSEAIAAAIESVYRDDGVLVLLDLGSAIHNAELAVELYFSAEQQPHIHLCEAPLVEGAIAAVGQARAGGDITQIRREARHSLDSKCRDLGITPPSWSTETTRSATALAVAKRGQQHSSDLDTPSELRLTILNEQGLHVRPSARFVRLAVQYKADITLRNITTDSPHVDAKSINQVMSVAARQGHQIGLRATGADAVTALQALQTLVEDYLGETDLPSRTATAPSPVTDTSESVRGIAVSSGIAIGTVVRQEMVRVEATQQRIADTVQEWARLQQAIEEVAQSVEAIYRQAKDKVGEAEAEIFQAHLMFLRDRTLTKAAQQAIESESLNAEMAWQRAITHQIKQFETTGDAALQSRIADVDDVGQRVLRVLTNTVAVTPQLSAPAILIVRDLTPSDTARLDKTKILGLCTELGSPTSHSAILARALGIPAVVGVGDMLQQVQDGQTIALNGGTGQVWLTPSEGLVSDLQQQRQAWLRQQRSAFAQSHQPAITQDEHRVEVVANIASLEEIPLALERGAEGVGLLRTEFLYAAATTPPTETEQLETYRAIARRLGHRPLVIRTLDIGGDKPLPYIDTGSEANPFLGWRGIRIGLEQPDLLRTQLRAILRASVAHRLKLMFPMIATLSELRQAKQILADVQADLRHHAIPFDESLAVGVMMEIPSAIAIADQLAQEVDFFSIGTNDLTQYAVAADRTNPRVARLTDPFEPAVLRLIKQTIDAGHAANKWVGLCGEFAGNPLAVPILLGLGLDEFSMNATAIPTVKQTINQWTLTAAQTVAAHVLTLESAEAVRVYLEERR